MYAQPHLWTAARRPCRDGDGFHGTRWAAYPSVLWVFFLVVLDVFFVAVRCCACRCCSCSWLVRWCSFNAAFPADGVHRLPLLPSTAGERTRVLRSYRSVACYPSLCFSLRGVEKGGKRGVESSSTHRAHIHGSSHINCSGYTNPRLLTVPPARCMSPTAQAFGPPQMQPLCCAETTKKKKKCYTYTHTHIYRDTTSSCNKMGEEDVKRVGRKAAATRDNDTNKEKKRKN